MELPEALAYLDRHLNRELIATSAISAGSVDGLSLGSMIELMALSGDPHRAYPVIHVTGTNGKGSVARMITELLVSSGLTVGSYYSPHLERINERICRNNDPISDAELAEAIGDLAAITDLLPIPPSWFELVPATALRWFADVAVDVAVIEVGLLGRYDATNVVDADVVVVTNVSGDHTDYSEGWRQKIAWEKAGIITAGSELVLGPETHDLLGIFADQNPGRITSFGTDIVVEDTQVAMGGRLATISTPYARYEDIAIAVHGEHQATNAAIALAAVERLFDRALAAEVVEDGLGRVRLPGRCEVLSANPLVILDGGHNAAAAESLASTLTEEFTPLGSRILIVGMLAGRRPADLLEPLVEVGFDAVIATSPLGERALPAWELAAAAKELGIACTVVADPFQAISRALAVAGEDDMLVVAGSFYLVAAARRAVATLGRERTD